MFFRKKPIFLGPMAGYGDHAFRRICRECGADVTVTEMVSAKAACFRDHKTEFLARVDDTERPCVLQIFGSDADTMARAARLLEEKYRPDGLDINMGCPAPKIFQNGDGSALLRDLSKAEKIVAAVRNVTKLPLSVKFRLGVREGENVAAEAAERFEAAGADYLIVHGRYRDQFYGGSADRTAIAAVKQSVSVPVIANGDIMSVETYADVLRETGADGVMIARGALGNPHLFTRLQTYKNEGSVLPPMPLREKLDVATRHFVYAVEDKGEDLAAREMRKHLMFYVKGVRGASRFKQACAAVCSLEDWRRLKEDIIRFASL